MFRPGQTAAHRESVSILIGLGDSKYGMPEYFASVSYPASVGDGSQMEETLVRAPPNGASPGILMLSDIRGAPLIKPYFPRSGAARPPQGRAPRPDGLRAIPFRSRYRTGSAMR
jgi:hypothetical protein